MGNTTSADVGAALPGGENVTPQTATKTTKVYRWVQAGTGGAWELASINAGLHLYDANEDADSKTPEWHLELDGPQESPDVVVNDSFEFTPAENRCVFVDEANVWAVQFPSPTAFEMFCQRYNKALFENNWGLENTAENNLKIFGADFLPRIHMEQQDSRDAWAEDMDVDDRPDPREQEAATPRRDHVAAERDAIQGVVMGAGDSSFLLRNSEIDVMRNVQGGVTDTGITFKVTPQRPGRLTVPSGTPGQGGALTPGKAILMDHETKMNMLTPGSSSLYQADIETGQTVVEFAFHRDGVDIPMLDMTNESKTSQLESSNTFLTVDHNRLAKWDARDPSGIVQQTGLAADMASPIALSYVSGKDYARGTKFSCMATSGDGYVVVGGSDGKVRLYNEKTLSQAKTAIPGMGAPITAVAVTFDGKWVLATTRSYMMVVKTVYKDRDTGREMCGFTSKMGSSAPAPRLLRLKPADVALTGGAPLEKGRFTWITERGRQERWIVASCGNYTVLWSFRAVKVAQPEVVSLGGLTTVTNYHLIPKSEHVVDSVFMHDRFAHTPNGNEETAMVVVTDRRVYTAADADEDEDEQPETPTLRRGLWKNT